MNCLVTIVYFANLYVNPKYGHLLILEQMKDLIKTGLLEHAILYILISVPSYPYFEHLDKIYNLFDTSFVRHRVIFQINHENCHEYPGIKMIHQLALENPSHKHYLLYFHSKSISRFKGIRDDPVEKALFTTVIKNWKHVLNIFRKYPYIDKIGSTSSPKGFIWWNYWWARASYLQWVESPIKTDRRYYYEDWLCRVISNPRSADTNPYRKELSLFEKNNYLLTDENCWGLSNDNNKIGNGTEDVILVGHLLMKNVSGFRFKFI